VSGELDDTPVEGHIESCPRCTSRCASLRSLVKQAQGLAVPAEMTEDARRAIAARLLATGPAPRARLRWPVVVVGVPAAAVAVAALVWTTRPAWRAPAPPQSTAGPVMGAPDGARSRATVRAIGAARYTRVQAPPDDVLRLDDGTIVLEVAPLPSGERFRVTTEDAEVEVRGTRFQVSASRGKLTGVTVASGRVEVRSAGGGRVVLDPGDEWVSGTGEVNDRGAISQEAESKAAESMSKPTRPPGLSRPRRARAESALVDPAAAPSIPLRAAHASFDLAWSLLRQGDARQAAALFAEVERKSGDSDIAEDALYWRSVATARAGDRPAARALFESFLRRFPASSRMGAAAAALGWLYLENAQKEEARRAFERATGDPSPAVRASAQKGLRRASAP
jgi:TolA-binding protein